MELPQAAFDLGNLLKADERVARFRSEYNYAACALSKAEMEQRMAHLLSQYEPVNSLGIDREKLRQVISFIKTGKAHD